MGTFEKKKKKKKKKKKNWKDYENDVHARDCISIIARTPRRLREEEEDEENRLCLFGGRTATNKNQIRENPKKRRPRGDRRRAFRECDELLGRDERRRRRRRRFGE